VTTMTDIAVRMGERAVSTGDTLVCFGLGSCIGVVLLDRRRGLAGMAHIMLPDPAPAEVTALIDELVALGALRPRIEAVIAGGAQMFAAATGLEIGARNDEAVRSALGAARVPLRAASTGGQTGRTMRVNMDDPITVTSRPAGGVEEVLA
jgi:chemotaxis protein CheD